MQTIYLDISNKGVYPCIYAKQSEVGRKFLAVINDGGVPYNIPENSLLSVWYEGDTDAGNYSSIEEKSAFSIDGNKVTVELVAQMLLKPGNGELCLSVTHGDGGETNMWNIPYCVEHKPGAGSSVPTEYYTALTEAGAVAAENATVAREQAQIAKQQADLAKAYVDQGLLDRLPAVESDEYPGCYYRTVGGETEWVNPPMMFGVQYRTTERHDRSPVYVKCINIGTLPASGSIWVETGVHANRVIRCETYTNNGGVGWEFPMQPGGSLQAALNFSGSDVGVHVYKDCSTFKTAFVKIYYV